MSNPLQLIEDGFVSMSRGVFLLNEERRYQEAYDNLSTVIDLLEEFRQQLRQENKLDE